MCEDGEGAKQRKNGERARQSVILGYRRQFPVYYGLSICFFVRLSMLNITSSWRYACYMSMGDVRNNTYWEFIMNKSLGSSFLTVKQESVRGNSCISQLALRGGNFEHTVLFLF